MVRIENLLFRYPGGRFALQVDALRVAPGECVAVVGPSGSGKTTLLQLISGILIPAKGRISVNGEVLAGQNDAWLRRFRLRNVGHIFQSFALLPYLSVLDNIMLPPLADATLRAKIAPPDALALLDSVGLDGYAARFPQQLSQGEQQRVAVCRALVVSPSLVIADEPTGDLDSTRAESVLDLMLERSAQAGATFIMSTHNRDHLGRFSRTIDVAEFAGGGQ